MHIVPLPHWPLVVTTKGPVGIGIEVEDVLDGGTTTTVLLVVVVIGLGVVLVVVLVVEVVEVDVGVGVGVEEVVEVVEAGGAGGGQPQTPYCSWQSKRGWQWSTVTPQKP